MELYDRPRDLDSIDRNHKTSLPRHNMGRMGRGRAQMNAEEELQNPRFQRSSASYLHLKIYLTQKIQVFG